MRCWQRRGSVHDGRGLYTSVEARKKQESSIDWCTSVRGLFVISFLKPRPWGLCDKHRPVGKEDQAVACVWHSGDSLQLAVSSAPRMSTLGFLALDS